MSTRTQRLRGSAAFTGALVIGAAAGIGGASLALWSDAEEVSGAIGAGYEYFAVGSPGDEALTEPGDATVHFGIDGPGLATVLLAEGAAAVPIQVDSQSQGNKGLTYSLALPEWGTGILGAAEIDVVPVAAAADCQVGVDPPDQAAPGPGGGQESTPVSAHYDDGSLITEYWCVLAALPTLPDVGAYTNVGTVSANDPQHIDVDSSDEWSAEVSTGMVPEEEDQHTIVFTYSTFRPGERP